MGTAPETAVAGSGALLPARALAGHRIGISVSDSPDLARLGLTAAHLKLAVRELARTVLVGGGTLAYGGHLRPGGFTEFLMAELGQYASAGLLHEPAQEVALLLCLSQQEHRKNSLDELDQVDADLGLYGEMRCLDLQGRVLPDRSAGRGPAGEPYPADKAVLAAGLTAMRHYMIAHTSARMLIGGRRHGATGAMPGLVEEALLALQAEQPLFLAAGFGGSTRDLAAAIDPRCVGLCPPHEADAPLEPGAVAGIAAVCALVAPLGWRRLNNGLDEAENLHLATTHRPAEIASLIGLGLGRWARQRG
jgi:hypothetical protein